MILALVFVLPFVFAKNTPSKPKSPTGTCQPPTNACLRTAGIQLKFSDTETALFVARLCDSKTKRYLEFGVGQSTLLAAHCNVDEIVSVDNTLAAQLQVDSHPIWNKTRSHLQQLHVGMGRANALQKPKTTKPDETYIDFVHYAHPVLRYTQGFFDVILVDGKFKLGSSITAMQRMHPRSALFIHDDGKGDYHGLDDHLQLVKRVGKLSQFSLPTIVDVFAIEQLMHNHAHEIN